MRIIDRGSGPPVVVIPGVQGRWEWMKPGIDALAARTRVVTFSLSDEPSCEGRFDVESGFDCYVEQVRDAMDQAGIERATVCGVSYGGLVAAAFAARHPERVHALVLISALPTSWQPNARVRFYMRAPRLLMPLFMLASLRMYTEVAAANTSVSGSVRQAVRHGWNVLTHMFSPSRMARRVELLSGARFDDVRDVRVPTLVIVGESRLDLVVPVAATREYLRTLPHARLVTVERTGHLGFITRPDVFADLIVPFAAESVQQSHATEPTSTRRRIG
jgi:pimeloyl-ACP methyl ester carboxylesterase